MTDEIKVKLKCTNCSHDKFVELDGCLKCKNCGHVFTEDEAVDAVVDDIVKDIAKGIPDKI